MGSTDESREPQMSIERVETNPRAGSGGPQTRKEPAEPHPAAGLADAAPTVGSGGVVYVSGNVGFGPDGKVVAGGVGPESPPPFVKIQRGLTQAGAGVFHS